MIIEWLEFEKAVKNRSVLSVVLFLFQKLEIDTTQQVYEARIAAQNIVFRFDIY